MFGWAWLAFVLWNGATIWGLWYSTPVGPFAATLVSTFLNMLAFMLYHTVSKRAHKALAYTLLVAGWIATEYWYTVGEFSFPWLLLGNGFSHEVWAVQWYEYTGVFGGSLWVLLCNLLFFEAWLHRRSVRHWVRAALAVVVPAAVSLAIYACWEEPAQRIETAVVQPNVDCYDKFNTAPGWQHENLLSLLAEVPSSAQLIAMPETALVEGLNEAWLSASPSLAQFEAALAADHPDALLVVGADTYKVYAEGNQTATARFRNGVWYDRFNTALALDAGGVRDIHHKSRLVIGVEKMPLPWLFDWLSFLIIDLGGTTGQLGVDTQRTVFAADSVRVAPAVCYESVYGAYVGEFVRGGAQLILVITNGTNAHHPPSTAVTARGSPICRNVVNFVEVVNFVDKHHDKMVESELSFFEMTAAMAFDYFAQSDVEVAVIETGLGRTSRRHEHHRADPERHHQRGDTLDRRHTALLRAPPARPRCKGVGSRWASGPKCCAIRGIMRTDWPMWPNSCAARTKAAVSTASWAFRETRTSTPFWRCCRATPTISLRRRPANGRFRCRNWPPALRRRVSTAKRSQRFPRP